MCWSGVKLSNDVNANLLSNIHMMSIGQYAYLLTYRATENTITGGFVGGGGGKVTVIKSEGASLNWSETDCRALLCAAYRGALC